jgi:ABC-type transport system substrate-binding protein
MPCAPGAWAIRQETTVSFKTTDRRKPVPRQVPCRARAAARGVRGPGAWVLIAAVMALALLPAGCSNSPYPEKDANTNTLYNSMTEDPQTLDPALTYGSGSSILMDIVETPLQFHYLDRPYKLDPQLAVEVPKIHYEQVEYDGNTTRRPVYTVRIKRNVMYQNHPCFVEAYRRLSDADFAKIKSIDDFKETATREMTADDFIYGVRRLCDQRMDFPVYSQFSTNLLGLTDYSHLLNARVDAERKKRSDAAGPLYNREMDEQFNPIILDYNQGADKYPFVRKIDRYTFQVVLSREYPQILYWMTFGFFSPIPHEALEFFNQRGMLERDIAFGRNPVGTGPYMLESYDPTNQVVIVRNPNFRDERYPYLAKPDPNDAEAVANYNLMKDNGLLEDCGKKVPFVDRIVARIEREAIPRWNKFMQGYYDSSGVQTEQFDQTISLSSQGGFNLTDSMADRGIRLLQTTTASLAYYLFNMEDPVFGGYEEKKQKLRRAISIAIDTGEAIDIFRNGMAIESQGPVPPGIFGNEPGKAGMNPYVFDWDPSLKRTVRKPIEEAKKLLVEAGYPGGYDANGEQLKIHFVTWQVGPQNRASQQLLVKQLLRINVKLDIEPLSWNEFDKKVKQGGYQLAPFGWAADYPDPETFFILLYKADNLAKEARNNPMYDRPLYRELYKKMSAMENFPERLAIIRQMNELLRKDAPAVFDTHGMSISLVHGWLRNYFPYPLSRGMDKYMRIDTAARTAYRGKYNQPDYWPVGILLGALVCLATPALLMTRRHLREK